MDLGGVIVLRNPAKRSPDFGGGLFRHPNPAGQLCPRHGGQEGAPFAGGSPASPAGSRRTAGGHHRASPAGCFEAVRPRNDEAHGGAAETRRAASGAPERRWRLARSGSRTTARLFIHRPSRSPQPCYCLRKRSRRPLSFLDLPVPETCPWGRLTDREKTAAIETLTRLMAKAALASNHNQEKERD